MRYIRRFSEIRIEDIALVGGKNASLGELYNALLPLGVNVPNGFAITAEAYRHFITHNHLDERIAAALEALDTDDIKALASTGALIRE
ncbi:MAG: phosphoenolpyruvate synthase, partial [Chromatiales bacterium]|nr:phosphoenolpyruvate synthase [Chromatiales bacterium]